MSEVVKEGQSGIPEIIAPKEVMALIAALRGDVPEKLRRLFAACERNAKRAGQLQELVNGVGRMGYDDYRALLEYIRKARSVKKAEEPTGLSDPLIQTTVERDHPTLLPIIERLLAVRNSLPTMAASGDQPPETHFLSEAALLTRLVFPAATNALNAEAKSEVSSFHDAARPSTIYFGNRNDPSICIVIGENKGGTIRISGKWYEYAGGERKNEVTSEAEVPAGKPADEGLHPSNYQPAKGFRFWLSTCPVESGL